MWTPINIDAIPSSEEAACAKLAIEELEILLKSAVEVVEEAKLRVINLEKEIEGRRAWMAPIRKLPTEILSEIFIFGSRIDRFMPVSITEVSRYWRRVILSTPKAWSIIDLDYPKDYDGDANASQNLETFMDRSDPYTVHLHVAMKAEEGEDEGDDDEYEEQQLLQVVNSADYRIECLCIPSRLLIFMAGIVFPNLTTLSILPDGYYIKTSYFTRSISPRLRFLNSRSSPWEPPDAAHLFPPLEYLTTDANDPNAIIEIIKGCCSTLKGLEVEWRRDNSQQPAPVTIHLPLLEHLEFYSSSSPVEWTIQATTPALRSYEEGGSCKTSKGILHRDVKHVTHFRCYELPQLHPFISLRVLQLWTPEPVDDLVEQLRRKEICPALESIQLVGSLTSEIESMIKTARPHIEITSVGWSDLPGSQDNRDCDHAWG